MLRAVAAYSSDHRIRYWYMLTTPVIARMMKRFNFDLIKAGPAVEFRGKRFPFLAHVGQNWQRLGDRCDTLAEWLRYPTPYLRYSELLGDDEVPYDDQALGYLPQLA
jgi:hypothetical protein